MRRQTIIMTIAMIAMIGLIAFSPASAYALDDAHYAKADEAAKKGIAFLKSKQLENGSFSEAPIPGITGLVVASMLRHPDITTADPAVKKGIEFILSSQKEDGGIYGQILPNYNTSLCLSALALADRDDPRIEAAIKKAQQFLIRGQWQEGTELPDGTKITKDHPHYGGAGYLKYGRPDMSNTIIMIDALYDSGIPCEDPAFVRAIEFIHRNQGTASNKKFGDQIVQDGGFIYSLSGKEASEVGQPTSMAGTVELEGGETRLRTYGSMTYAGFKSYLYAQLPKDDQRVIDAWNWIRSHYTLERNPGMPHPQRLQGLYFYYVVFARALHAWGEPTFETTDGKKIDWANEIIAELAERQNENGSWANEEARWMESDPVLSTGYALTALGFAMTARDAQGYTPSNKLFESGELKKK